MNGKGPGRISIRIARAQTDSDHEYHDRELTQDIQLIPEKHFQGFCFQDSQITLSTHFR